MSNTPTNNDILSAIAKVIDCRSHRRGRKPSWNILIHTTDDNKVNVIDLETGCKAKVGGRTVKKAEKAEKAKRKYTKRAPVSVPVSVDERISPVTGKPVRKYTKRTFTIPEITSEEIRAADKALTDLAEAKVQLAQAKLSRDATDDTKKRMLMDKAIGLMEKKVKELDSFVNG